MRDRTESSCLGEHLQFKKFMHAMSEIWNRSSFRYVDLLFQCPTWELKVIVGVFDAAAPKCSI
uniref:Uncharacterized protein n=1 Tax=Rhizophora mucronata TaxID=61149 RepID=A0A2P2NJK3_RHIMU